MIILILIVIIKAIIIIMIMIILIIIIMLIIIYLCIDNINLLANSVGEREVGMGVAKVVDGGRGRGGPKLYGTRGRGRGSQGGRGRGCQGGRGRGSQGGRGRHAQIQGRWTLNKYVGICRLSIQTNVFISQKDFKAPLGK